MARPTGDKDHRTTAERDAHRQRIAELYLRQWSQLDIANELKISQPTVSRDLAAVQKQWRESAVLDMNEAKQRELARIDTLEREYWQAWEASKKDIVTTRQKGIKIEGREVDVKEVTLEKRTSTGNPAYLAGVMSCIEQRCKILGLVAPPNVNINNEIGLSVNADTFALIFSQQQRLATATMGEFVQPDGPTQADVLGLHAGTNAGMANVAVDSEP